MPYSDLNFGKVVPGYMAHCWFGRPLLLANAVPQSFVKDKIFEALNSKLALGCDGFAYRLGTELNDQSSAEQMALFEEILQTYSQKAFLYIEIKVQGIERPLFDILRRHTFPSGHMIASRNPETLHELYCLDSDFFSKLALIVGAEKDFSGLMRCPYTTVDITDALATHERILQIHKSGKEIFVRAKFGRTVGEADEKETGKIEKRVQWLMHEGVDAIISDSVDLLSSVLGVGARTQPNNGMHPTAK